MIIFLKPHTFSVNQQYQIYRKCVEKLSFSENWSRTPLHSRFSVFFLWTRKLLFSKSIKYMNSGRISWLWIPIQIFEFITVVIRLFKMSLTFSSQLDSFRKFQRLFLEEASHADVLRGSSRVPAAWLTPRRLQVTYPSRLCMNSWTRNVYVSGDHEYKYNNCSDTWN